MIDLRFNVIDDVIQKVQRHVDLIKLHAVTFIRSTCNNAVDTEVTDNTFHLYKV